MRETMDPGVYRRVCEELSLLEGAGSSFDLAAVQAGTLTPVFFGSAANNFGVHLLLDRFLQLAPPPAPRKYAGGIVQPTEKGFSGFVFKIQANMNPKHRDRVAFIRIVSGTFERDMMVINTRTGKRIRLSNSQRLFAKERETIDTAFAGDVVGIVGNHDFLMGDTLAERRRHSFRRDPTLRSGVLRVPAQHQLGQVQALPRGAGAVAEGRARAIVRTAGIASVRAAAGRGRAAAVRGVEVPAGIGIRRGVPSGSQQLEDHPLDDAASRVSCRKTRPCGPTCPAAPSWRSMPSDRSPCCCLMHGRSSRSNRGTRTGSIQAMPPKKS